LTGVGFTSGAADPGFRFSGEVFEVKFNGAVPAGELSWYAPWIEEDNKKSDDGSVVITNRQQKFDQGSVLEQPMSAERILW
jgi:hypothetical protein